MSAPTSPVAKRARTHGPPHRAPPLKCRSAGGRYKDVQSVVSADNDGRLLVRFADGTQLADADGAARPVAKKELVFFAPQQPPDATRQLAGLVGAPRFFQGQQECFDHAGSNGHAFFGAFQIFRKKWGWSACQCQEKRATCEACGVDAADVSVDAGGFYDDTVYQYFSFPSVTDFLHFYEAVPPEKRFFFEILREGTMIRSYLDVDNLVAGAQEPSNDAMDKIIPLLMRFYQSVFGSALLPAQISVTTGGRAKPTGYKNSWHICLDTGFGFYSPPKGSDGDMKLFMFAFIEALRHEHPELLDNEVRVPHGNLPVDHRVYTTNRAMRIAGSCKVGETHALQCIARGGDDDRAPLEKYLLQTDEALQLYTFTPEMRAQLVIGAKMACDRHAFGREGSRQRRHRVYHEQDRRR